MSKLERLYHLHNILSQRRTPISRQLLMEELGCSQATLYRLVADLRDHLGAPIEQDPDNRGFYYDRNLAGHFELPGRRRISVDENRSAVGGFRGIIESGLVRAGNPSTGPKSPE